MELRIGLTPSYDDVSRTMKLEPEYQEALLAAGGTPVVLPLTQSQEELNRYVQTLDGFLMTGGHDINPQLYGETKPSQNEPLCDALDNMGILLLQAAMLANQPIFGICRGMQLCNVALGGTLYQDLPTQMAVVMEHNQLPPYHRPVHEVVVDPDSPLFAITGESRLSVNSYHHQGIRQLSPELKAMAQTADGLIEAVYHPQYSFLLATQWHPESLYQHDAMSRKLLAAFISACRHRKEAADQHL